MFGILKARVFVTNSSQTNMSCVLRHCFYFITTCEKVLVVTIEHEYAYMIGYRVDLVEGTALDSMNDGNPNTTNVHVE